MQALNLPPHPFKIVDEGGKLRIFDPVRRKYLVLSPEEWVRQHFIQYLIAEKQFPAGLFKLEAGLKNRQRSQRYDAVVATRQGHPLVLIECKAPSVKLTADTYHQIARYNQQIQAPFLALSNGLQHQFLKIDLKEGKMYRLKELPHYSKLTEMNAV